MSSDGCSVPAVRVERLLSAPIDDVFAAWTDASSMSRWLSPRGHAEVEADVRVGGQLRVVMIGDGMRIEHRGEFRAVDPPTLLVFTWRSPYTGDLPSLVTVRLRPVTPTETSLVLVHEQLPPETAESHQGGWTAIVENLAAAVAAGWSPGTRTGP